MSAQDFTRRPPSSGALSASARSALALRGSSASVRSALGGSAVASRTTARMRPPALFEVCLEVPGASPRAPFGGGAVTAMPRAAGMRALPGASGSLSGTWNAATSCWEPMPAVASSLPASPAGRSGRRRPLVSRSTVFFGPPGCGFAASWSKEAWPALISSARGASGDEGLGGTGRFRVVLEKYRDDYFVKYRDDFSHTAGSRPRLDSSCSSAAAAAGPPSSEPTPRLALEPLLPRSEEQEPPQPPTAAAVPPPRAAAAKVASNNSPWAALQQRWHSHQQWAAEAWDTIAVAVALDGPGSRGPCAEGLPPRAFGGAACTAKLLECVPASGDAAARSAAARPLTIFLTRRAAAEASGHLPYEEFETFTWKLLQMESPGEIEAKPDFVFKMFGGSKIGRLTRAEFMQWFQDAAPADALPPSDKQDAAGFREVPSAADEPLGPSGAAAAGQAPASEDLLPATPAGSAGAPAWGDWAAPSEASSSGGSRCSSPERGGRVTASRSSGRWPSRRSGSGDPELPCMSQEQIESLLTAPGAWRDLVRKKGLMHRDWATSRFASLDTDGDGKLKRSDLAGAAFARVLLECLGDRLPDPEDVEALVDAAARGAGVDGELQLAQEDFEAFTWRLKRMVADTDFEVIQALGGEASSVWRSVLVRAKAIHKRWAMTAFEVLDAKGAGTLTRAELRQPGFEYVLRQCPGGQLADTAGVRPCVGLAFRRADTKGTGRLSRQTFEEFTWQLARMGVDVEAEGRRFAELAKGGDPDCFPHLIEPGEDDDEEAGGNEDASP